MEPEPEPEPELELPGELLPPAVVEDAEAIAASARVRAAAGHLHAARHHMEAAEAADRHNMGGPQYALAIQSLETALRVDPQAEWMDGRGASIVLKEARAQLGERQRERDAVTVAAATASAPGGLLERAVGSASSWLHLSSWMAGSRFAPEPCDLVIPPGDPVQGSLMVTSSCLEFQPIRLANSTNRPLASSIKRLWNSGEDGSPGQTLAVPLTSIVNCFERSESVCPSAPANGSRNATMAPPVGLPPTDAEQSEDDALAAPHGYVEAPEETRTVVVTYSVGCESSVMHQEASYTLTAGAADSLLGVLEPIVERYHAERVDSGSTVSSTSDTRIVYERVYFQCEIDGQAALDSGTLQVDRNTSLRGHGCVMTFEGSFHRLSIPIGVIPDALGGSDAGELLHVRVRDDIPEVRGRQTVHVVHQPPDGQNSIAMEWLLEQEEATNLCAQLSAYVGPFTHVQERFVEQGTRQARAKDVAASVAGLLEAVPPIIDAARNHSEKGRYAMASTMLTLEMLKMHCVIDEWRSLGCESSAGASFAYESSEEKEFEALGYLFSNCGTLEAQYSVQGRHRMQVWGMLSDQLDLSDVWRQGFYVLDGGVVSRFNPWNSEPEDSFKLSSVLAVDEATSTRKSAFELVATLGLDGLSNNLPEHVLAVTLVHEQAPDVIDSVIGAAASLFVGDDHVGDSSGRKCDQGEGMIGVGRELTQQTNELFARVSEDGDWSTETRKEAMRLSQSHLEFGEENAVSAASADRYGLGGPQWELAVDAFRNALRLRPSDDRWGDGREDGSASRALVEAEAGAANSGALPQEIRADSSSKSTKAPVIRYLQAPDAASFDIWKSALTPIAADVFAVQFFPVQELSLHLYKVDRTGGGGRGHWGGGGAGLGKKKSPNKSGARPPREDRGWTTRHCRLFSSTLCFHEENTGTLGAPVGASIDLWQVVKGSVHVVPPASASREHYGRVGAVLSMVEVVPPSDDGDGNFSSGSTREICIASSDEVVIAQWEQAVIDQLDKQPELPGDDETGASPSTEFHAPTLAAPWIGSAAKKSGSDDDNDDDDDEDDWYEDDELVAIAT